MQVLLIIVISLHLVCVLTAGGAPLVALVLHGRRMQRRLHVSQPGGAKLILWSIVGLWVGTFLGVLIGYGQGYATDYGEPLRTSLSNLKILNCFSGAQSAPLKQFKIFKFESSCAFMHRKTARNTLKSSKTVKNHQKFSKNRRFPEMTQNHQKKCKSV